MSLTDHVALAVDFSEPSKVALSAAFRVAGRAGIKRVTVIHSLQQVVLPDAPLPAVKARLEDLRERMRAAAKKQMAEMCDAAGPIPAGVVVDHLVVEGTPARAIPIAVEAVGATLLGMGTHARKGLGRWLKGSVCEAIVRTIQIPTIVFVTGTDAVGPDEELSSLDIVLVALDAYAGSDHVAEVAAEITRDFGGANAKLTLFTAANAPSMPHIDHDDPSFMAYVKDLEVNALARLEAIEAKIAPVGLESELRVMKGDPDARILELADEVGAKMIVVGSHGQDGAPPMQLGSTTEYVIRHANVSVLIVPSLPGPEVEA